MASIYYIIAIVSRSIDEYRCSVNERDLQNASGRPAADRTAPMALRDASVSILSGSPWDDGADRDSEAISFYLSLTADIHSLWRERVDCFNASRRGLTLAEYWKTWHSRSQEAVSAVAC